MLLLRAKGLYKQTPNCLSSVVHCIHPLWLHGLQHVRLPCPSPTSGVYSNSCPLSRWCHPTISSSVAPFSSYLQSFPASGSFQMSQFFASGGQSRKTICVCVCVCVFFIIFSVMVYHCWYTLCYTLGPCCERLLLNHEKMPGFLASGGDEFNLGPEMRLDCSELCVIKFY